MSQNVEAYLSSKGWPYKIKHEKSGAQAICKPCPLCGDNTETGRPFYISVTDGRWQSYCCHETGNMFTLRERMGDLPTKTLKKDAGDLSSIERVRQIRSRMMSERSQNSVEEDGKKGWVPNISDIDRWHSILMSHDEGLKWLMDERGFTKETIAHFKLGWKTIGDRHYLSIPTIVNGEVKLCKLRDFDPEMQKEKKWRRIAGMQSALFGEQDIIDNPGADVYLHEAELDAIASWQLGLRPSVASSLGAGNFADEWIPIVESADNVYIMYDQFDDDKVKSQDKTVKHAGDDGAEKVAAKLGKYRCHRVIFPAHDSNEWLRKNPTKDEIADTIKSAVPYHETKLISLYELSLSLSTVGVERTYPIGLPALDKLLGGGLRMAEVTILTADSSIGKTTFSANVGLNFAKTSGPVCYWPIEGGKEKLAYKTWDMTLGKRWKETTKDERDAMILGLKGLPFIPYPKGAETMENTEALIMLFSRRFGGKLLIIDHLRKLITSATKDSSNENLVTDKWQDFLSEMAKRYSMHIWAILHPKKPEGSDATFEPEMHQLKGSTSNFQDPDNVIALSRKRTANRDSDEEQGDLVPTRITIKKQRDDDAPEGSAIMFWHRQSQRYLTIDPRIVNKAGGYTPEPESNSDDCDFEVGEPE